jgi:two-component system, NarL family, invasion response regulator UvrY
MNKTNTAIIKVALADDHTLLRNALAALIDEFGNCKVVCQCGNGEELIQHIQQNNAPDVVILDLNMPVMNGYETADWLQQHHPATAILMLTMYDSEIALIRLLHSGVKGFLKKDIHPKELEAAIYSVMQNGYYYSHYTNGKLANLFLKGRNNDMPLNKAIFSEKEIEFIKLSCTELTYKEIAAAMDLNPRAIDNMRDGLFVKLDIKSRVALAMYAMKNGLAGF